MRVWLNGGNRPKANICDRFSPEQASNDMYMCSASGAAAFGSIAILADICGEEKK